MWREGHAGDGAACSALSELRGALFCIFVGAVRPVAAPEQSVYTGDEAQLFIKQTRDLRKSVGCVALQRGLRTLTENRTSERSNGVGEP